MDPEFKKEVIISGGVIVASILIFGIASWYLANGISEQAAQIIEKRTVLAEWARSVSTLGEFRLVAPEVEKYEAQIKAILPGKEGLIDFGRVVETIARVNRVKTIFNFEGEAVPAQVGVPGYIAFSLRADGNFADIQSFFTTLHGRGSKFLISLSGLDLQRAGEEYHAAVQGRVYFR